MRSPYARRRPVENSYLVRERDRRLVRELTTVLAAVAVLGAGLLAYTWMHIEILKVGYSVEELERQLREILERERRLRLEAAYRAHPARLQRRAAEELGMQEPRLHQMVFYRELQR